MVISKRAAAVPVRQGGVRVPVRRFAVGGNRLITDAFREIRNTFSRFLSILVLSALAVAFLSGLRATAPDMQYTADRYYDRTHMMDGYVLSPLGLTREDLDALAAAEGVEQVEGARTVDAIAAECIVSVRSLPERLNLPEVREGRLPQAADECVTERLLLIELCLEVGDTLELTLHEDNEGDLERTSYAIVGVVECPLYVGTDRGTSSLGSGKVNGFVFVPGENFTYDYYTVAYFTGTGLEALDSYSDEYEEKAEALIDSLDGLGSERGRLRYDTVIADARRQLDDARAELEDARASADAELADGWQALEDARKELDEGWAEYYEGVEAYDRETADAQRELADALATLNATQAMLSAGRTQYQTGLAQYNAGLAAYESALAQYQAGLAEYERGKAVLDELQAQVAAGQALYDAALARVEGTALYDTTVSLLARQKAQLDEGKAQLDQAYALMAPMGQQLEQAGAVLDATKKSLDSAKAMLDSTRGQTEEGWMQLAAGWAEYAVGVTQLDQARRDGERELAEALEQLEDGEAQYAEGLAEYESGKAEAEEKLADAQRELDDAQARLDKIEDGPWYILGRNTNAGFVSFAQDTERIGNLAAIFPVIFFLVAALACLTTMTRMVEEQRTQIGALKALGFSRLSISTKYLGYALLASLTGGVLGLALGCVLIPAVIANAFNIMYAMPPLEFREQTALCVLAVLAAVACTTGAALWACLSTLMDAPANLMRPRAPKAGRRVLLERADFIWQRLTFTWKVTMRNLFRYQRRFWMTVIGIGGCTALIVTGFGLHESIFSILNEQFDHVFLYGATVGLDPDAGEDRLAEVEEYLDGSPWVEDYLPVNTARLEISAGGPAQSVTMFAVDNQDRFTQFIRLGHRLNGDPVTLPGNSSGGVVITEKLSELLGVSVGDSVVLDGDRRVKVRVADIAENYVQHYVYLSDACYRELFGENPEQNEVLLRYAGGAGETGSDAVSAALMAMEAVTSYSYIATLRDTFTDSMEAIDYAVVIIIIAAAALAFVVLYNLTNINITERTRELATLKVLGFFDAETTAYVYRENIFLTAFGIILGLVLGRLLHAWMVVTVEVDLVMFGRTAPPYAYVLAAVFTVAFSVMVNIAAHFKLKKVDMVESLKTVE